MCGCAHAHGRAHQSPLAEGTLVGPSVVGSGVTQLDSFPRQQGVARFNLMSSCLVNWYTSSQESTCPVSLAWDVSLAWEPAGHGSGKQLWSVNYIQSHCSVSIDSLDLYSHSLQKGELDVHHRRHNMQYNVTYTFLGSQPA